VFVAEGVGGLLRDKTDRPPAAAVGAGAHRRGQDPARHPRRSHPLEQAHDGRVVGLGKTSILKIWREHGLKPHLTKTFKVSRDSAFVDKVRGVVGLYLNPPEHTMVSRSMKKNQVQALDVPGVLWSCASRDGDDRAL
jgi:hypothetical protein